MHLIVVHGVPGVGKRTVCNELSRLTSFPFMNSHHIAVLLGPVLGFSTPAFNEQRDRIYDGAIVAAADAGIPGLIATCIFEPSVKLERFEAHVRRCRETGGEALFVGLQCAPGELRQRMTSADRAPLGKWTDFEAMNETMASGYFDFPELPWPSLVVDSTGMSAAETAGYVFERLPAGMKVGAR